MKIAHVIPALTKGGAERVVVDLANAAVKSGHEVTVIAAMPAPPHLLADRLSREVALIYLGRSLRGSYLRLPVWLYCNRDWLFEQDVVHCHLTFGSVFGSALQRIRFLSKRGRPALVETYHAVGMAIPARMRAAHALLLRGRDAVAFMADDPYWAGYANRHPETIFRTIPNGIDPPAPPIADASENYQRDFAQIPADASMLVGTVSRLVAERRPDLLLDAFTYAAKAIGSGVHMLIGGEGPESVALDRMARQRRIREQVHMPGFVLNPADPISLMDLFLTVNVGSATGIAALEAAFLGVPIIAVQLQQGYCSRSDDWIWSSTSPSEVGRMMVKLINDPAALRDLATRQQAIARARFSIDAMSEAYDQFYGAALDCRPRRRGGMACQ